jgi:hypothetical protein
LPLAKQVLEKIVNERREREEGEMERSGVKRGRECLTTMKLREEMRNRWWRMQPRMN